MKKRSTFFLVIAMSLVLFSFERAAAQRIINFAGVDWQVKDGGPWGPGPNYWSGSENSVWVDDLGRLHLKVRKENGRWYCAEVSTTEYTQYGEHRFLVEGMIDRMDKNLVLGLFVYATDTKEIDVEYSKWGDVNKTDVGSFTVQPYSTPGNQHSFESPLDSAKTTHFFNWQPGYVSFGSMHGHYYDAPPSSNYYIEQWVYTGADIPSETDHLRTILNFWLMNGQPLTDYSITEIIITDVVQPLSTSMLDERNSNQGPKEFVLKQNYPNPFNPLTHISYQIASERNVQLVVYDILGQKVKKLLNTKQKKGRYTVKFNSDGLAGGVYFYRIVAGSFVQTRKMILIK